MRDITDRTRSEEERTDLLAREQRARLVAEAAESRAAFLAEASAVLASSLDYRTTLASVARLIVPRIADGCAVDMLDGEGRLRRLTTSHSDPSRVASAEEVARRYPPDLRAPHGAGHVVATGEPEILGDITDEILRATARDDEHYRLIRDLRLVSLMCVPLPARDRVMGAITLASSESGRRFGLADRRINLRHVVAGRLRKKPHAGIHRAALGVGGAVIEPPDPGERNRARTHGAGLQRDIEVAVDQPFGPDRLGRLPYRQDLGMRGRVAVGQRPVAGRGNHLVIPDDDAPDRNFAGFSGVFGRFQRQIHERRGSHASYHRKKPAMRAAFSKRGYRFCVRMRLEPSARALSL